MKKYYLFLCSLLFLCLCANSVSALTIDGTNYGDEITTSDENNSGSGWYGSQEDQEVEPGMDPRQVWDLEGFFLNGFSLTLVGGYDFVNGVMGYNAGDVFIDVNGDAEFGDIHNSATAGNSVVMDTFGYDYVFAMDYSAQTYELFQLNVDSPSYTRTAYYSANQGSNPWRYERGGVSLGNGTFDYETFTTDEIGGYFQGDNSSDFHNVISGLDLSFLNPGTQFTAHTTMQCGNDSLIGQAIAPVPEPASMLLLGSGLLGIGIIRRKRAKR